MKVELVIPKERESAAALAHLHTMTRELAFGLQLIGVGLLVLAVAVYLNGGSDARDR